MTPEYTQIQEKFERGMVKIGFRATIDSGYQCIYKNKEGWIILLEGERYYSPGFLVSVVHPESDDRFRKRCSIFRLFDVFQEKENPTVENIISFLIKNKTEIFETDKYHDILFTD